MFKNRSLFCFLEKKCHLNDIYTVITRRNSISLQHNQESFETVHKPNLLSESMQPAKQDDSTSEVILVLKHGKKIRSSRNELSAGSDFFSALLHSDMRENKEGVVHLEYITETVMLDVLEFMRCESVKILTPKAAHDLIEAADYLQLPKLKTFAGRFLEQELSPLNCVLTYYFALKYQCDDLATNTGNFILLYFSDVAESQEFLNLESQQVEQWICRDEIAVFSENEVFKIIMKWIYHSKRLKKKRKEKFAELFRHVRLAFISRDLLLTEIWTNKLVIRNSKCRKLVEDAMNGVYYTRDCPQSPRKWCDTCIVVRTGREEIFCFQPDKDKWYELADAPIGSIHHPHRMPSFHGKYVFPTESELDTFDPSLNCWSKLTNKNISNQHAAKLGLLCWKYQSEVSVSHSSVTVVRGEMYSISTEYSNHYTCECRRFISKYNLKSNKWDKSVPCKFALAHGACLVAMGDYLYVLGGVFRDEAFANALRLDTVKNKWKRIADMKLARYDTCGIAVHGKIFVAGGVDGNIKHTETCEMYNASTNEWQVIASLNVPRARASLLCLKEALYVVGGDCFGEMVKTIESYDFETEEWKQKTEIPIYKVGQVKSWTEFKACTLAILKGVFVSL